jgi:hypothetical protein
MVWPLVLLTLGLAQADDGVRLAASVPVTQRTIFDLRLGALAAPGLGPDTVGQACGRLQPLRRVSVEACGNGAGVLHDQAGADFAHFRLTAAAWQRRARGVDWSLGVGGGIAEVQRSKDAPGFRFGAARAEQVEAAGAEATLGLTARRHNEGVGHWVMDLTAGVAHIPGAPAVMGAAGPTVPFVGLSMGAGI